VRSVPTQMRERLAGTAIRGVTQPLLVLSLGFGLPAIALARFLDGIALYFDLGLAVFFPALFGMTHVYFMFANPDRLQSEDYRLRDRSLSLVESGRGVIRDPELLELSSSPVSSTPARKSAIATIVPDDIGENVRGSSTEDVVIAGQEDQ
jgi:hypothetical protein